MMDFTSVLKLFTRFSPVSFSLKKCGHQLKVEQGRTNENSDRLEHALNISRIFTKKERGFHNRLKKRHHK